MTTMADSLVNSASRPLKLRRRPDLEAKRPKYHGKAYWVVKEPVGLNYFRFHDEEYAILNMLDGETSLQQIKENFQAQFAPQRISLQELQQFVGMLHRSGLVISHAGGQGRQLRRRGDQKKRKERLGKLANVFAIRFRGIDPEHLLNRLLPWFGWLFTTWALFLVLMMGLGAVTLVLLNYHEFKTKLPSFEQFFAADKWVWLGLTMACVKILHEFGHGLSCKKFGGECHEMGLMFLVFTPCLYCNVSDSWMLPNKWQRIFIGAAGMYVELILASIATYLWWFSSDGMFNFLCLSVMFICSVSTVVFNGNPLLRFDGYYILMDLLEIPNLRQKANEILKRWFQKNCLGLEQPENPFLPTKNKFLFGAFTVASNIYRWVVTFGIIMFLNQVLKPYGLQSLGRVLAVAGIAGMIVPGVIGTVKFFRTPGKAAKMKRANILTSLTIAASVLSFVCFVPLPFHINCSLETQPKDGVEVRSVLPGQLIAWHKKPGDVVQEKEVICELDNIDLKLQLEEAINRINMAKIRYEQASYFASSNPVMQAQQIEYEKAYNAAVATAQEIQFKISRLQVRSPINGILFQPPYKKASKAAQAEDQLPSWSGNPFDPINSGATFAEGDLLCIVAPKPLQEGVLVVDQQDRDLVDVGDEVEIMFDSAKLRSYYGTVHSFAQTHMKETSANLSTQTGGSLDTKTDETGRTRPMSTSYQAKVVFADEDLPVKSGFRGKANVHLAWRSLGWRLYRFAAKTFNFDF